MGIKDTLAKYSPEIMTGLGIGGFFSAIIFAVKKTPDALVELHNANNEKGEELTPFESVKTVWMCYLPSAMMAVASTGLIIAGNRVQAKRGAAVAAAYKLSEIAYAEYRDAVVDSVGEKKERNIRGKLAEKRIMDYPVNEPIVTNNADGRPLCIDWPSKRYFRATYDEIRNAENKANQELTRGNGYISLSDFHMLLGLETSENGDVLGWSSENGLIDVDTSRSVTAPNGEPCMIVDYTVYPFYNFDKYYN